MHAQEKLVVIYWIVGRRLELVRLVGKSKGNRLGVKGKGKASDDRMLLPEGFTDP